jgi:hypothetical protein
MCKETYVRTVEVKFSLPQPTVTWRTWELEIAALEEAIRDRRSWLRESGYGSHREPRAAQAIRKSKKRN